MTKKAAPQKTKKLSVKKVTVRDLDLKGHKGAGIHGGGDTVVLCIPKSGPKPK